MRFGIVGDPVNHSRSPAIHTAGFQARGIDATYEYLPTPLGEFATVESMLRSGGLDGVSVTMPHKANAFAAVDTRTELANRTGAVNTIISNDGILTGTNTDVAGVRFSIDVVKALDGPVLVLGAGGAAAAAIVALEDRQVFVSARDRRDAASVLGRTGVEGIVIPWSQGVAGSVVVNATPVGMHGEKLPAAPLAVASALIDMAYGDGETPACTYATSSGINYADGIDMLVGQAVEAFTLFTGTDVPVDVLYDAARSGSAR